MQKHCTGCGRLIAEERGGEYFDVIRKKGMSYYAWIRRKYCPKCGEEAKAKQDLDYIHRVRKLNRQYNKGLRERNDLLEAQNAYFRDLLIKSGVL